MRSRPSRMALRVALLYALFARTWILVSDRLLLAFAGDPSTVGQWQTAKGWGFVVVTALLLYVVLRREGHVRQQAEDALRDSEERFRAIASNTPDHIIVQATTCATHLSPIRSSASPWPT
jgi:PAS domain-containing protein